MAKVVSLPPRKGGKQTDPTNLKLKISTSSGNQGRVLNQTTTWDALCAKLSETNRDSVTLDEYLAKPIAWQDKRKNQGFFVGGHFAGGARKLTALEGRTLLTFDVDNCPADLLIDLEMGVGWLGDYEYAVYSTRKHTPARPRVRVVVPVAETVSVPQYGPLSRIIASYLDETMAAVDPVSFRAAQIMYWPSTCKGADFVFARNRGAVLDGAEALAAWGDWTDYSRLPRSPREKDLRPAAEKADDPTAKRGIVGAFCRVYDVHAAIQTFLEGRYVLGQANSEGVERYSYVGGSTTNGAVVYEGGKFLYSYHSTDPCSDRLVNAFDLVRIHLFGDKDKPADDDLGAADVGERPQDVASYKALQSLLMDDKEVVKELRSNLYDDDAIDSDFSSEDVELGTVTDTLPSGVEGEVDTAATLVAKQSGDAVDGKVAPPPDDWRDALEVTDKGIIRSTLYNVCLILENDMRFRGALAHNEQTAEDVLLRRIRSKSIKADTRPVRDAKNGDPITVQNDAAIRMILEAPRGDGLTGYGLNVTDRNLAAAVTMQCDRHRFHPVRQYVEGCGWDGVPRVRQLWHSYFNADGDSEYHRQASWCWMVAAVARVYEPGAKFDFVPIIEGLTGIRKSTGLRELAGMGRFGELTAEIGETAKLVENIQGRWIMEIGELGTLRKADVDELKGWLSAQSDTVRLAFAKRKVTFQRQAVFAGTTNRKDYLKDRTGNRRFWPIETNGRTIDTDRIAADRDLLWAEAREHYLALRRRQPHGDLPLMLTGEAAAHALELQDMRVEDSGDDELLGMVRKWLDTPVAAGQEVPGWRPDPLGTDDMENMPRNTVRKMTCIVDIAHFVMGVDTRRGDRTVSRNIGRIMREVPGWVRLPTSRLCGGDLGSQKVFVRQERWRK